MAMSEAQRRAIDKYNKANIKQVVIKLNKKYDADIIEWYEKQSDRMASIREAIRQYMKKEGN